MGTYLVTGTNRGIGYEFCHQLAARGEQVIAVCRQSSKELDSLGVQVKSGIDIAESDAIARLTQSLADQSIDVLINNAGIYRQSSLGSLNIDGIREQFEINAIAPLRFTQALLPKLKDGGKVAIMTSRMGSIDDNTSGGSYGYRMSKVAVSMAGKSLSHDLRSRQIAVAILHPGLVSTGMTNFNPNGISPEESVTGLLKVIDAALTLETSGQFWHSNGQQLPW